MIEANAIIPLLIASGILTAVGETIRWFISRGKTKVDSAMVVQGMAIDLLKPLHEELARASADARKLRKQMNDLDREMEIIIAWAMAAKSILDREGIDYPPLPKLSERQF